MKSYLSVFLVIATLLLPLCQAGRGKGTHGSGRLMELLTAGIVAKVLQQKDDSHHHGGGGGGGGGGHGYYTVPIPMPVGHGHQKSHSHVTEKIIPIPIPHHTTRIIHINAGSPHGEGGEGGGFDHHGGLSGIGGDGGGYDDHHHHHHDIGGHDHEVKGEGHYHGSERHNHHHSPSIQQMFFQDGGVYGPPQTPRPLQPHASAMVLRRPVVGLVPHPASSMGMVMPHLHHPTLSAPHLHPSIPSPHLYPSLTSAHLYPSASSAAQYHPAVSGAHPQLVRVRHYYPLASTRHRMLAYPSLQQQRHQLLMMQQRRPPSMW